FVITLYIDADIQPSLSRQHEIEYNESRFFTARFIQSSSAIGCRRERVPCLAQVERQKIDDVAFVFDYQNPFAGRRFHSQQPYRRNYFNLPAPGFSAPVFFGRGPREFL